jgi:uncharacterized protein
MHYNVAQLLKEPIGALRKHQVDVGIEGLDADLVPSRPLVGTVTLMRTNRGILVTGVLETTLNGECRRCLEPCDHEVKLELEEEFVSSSPRLGAERVDDLDDDQDVALLVDDSHILDLSEVVRQGIWLSEPWQALCREDCAGLCPHCGGNRNQDECDCDMDSIDPRWAALQALLPNTQDSRERSD